MTKYNRITGKVFGANANATGDNPEIGQFGSAKDGSYIGTSDISTIQALPAWGQGWAGAVTPETNFPPLPEMTGVMKVLSEQQCYLLQQGVSEWDNVTIYYQNNFSSKNGKIYISQSDENQGNDPETDNTNWKEFLLNKLDIDASNLNAQGKSYVSGLSMPSNKSTDINILASGSTYTAPESGWISVKGVSSTTTSFIHIYVLNSDGTEYYGENPVNTVTGGAIATLLPVKKNAEFQINYDRVTSLVFKFIYTEGENN